MKLKIEIADVRILIAAEYAAAFIADLNETCVKHGATREAWNAEEPFKPFQLQFKAIA